MLKVLIIDDDKITRELLKKVLLKQTQEQFVVIEAEDGRQGVEYALNYQPDLIICDIMMPHVDGYETCRQIESQSDVHIPFIFLTAKDAREDFRKGMSLGADDFITKPFQSTDLLQAICTRMRKHKKIESIK